MAAALRIRTTPDAERQVRGGHPWIFKDSIRSQSRPGEAGDVAVLYDRRDRFLALGLFDPESPIAVRVLHTGRPQPLDGGFWDERLATAIARRQGVADEKTNGLRWIYGENDGWPGLVLDAYADTLVIKIYTAAWFPHLADQVVRFHQRFNASRIVLRLSRNLTPPPDYYDGMILHGPAMNGSNGQVEFLETGLRFGADVVRGQKTGFFLDQRDNRVRIGEVAADRRVLNLFSFSGGFSLHAARGGAISVTDVDISAHALQEAAANWQRNITDPQIAHCHREAVQADVFDWLRSATQSAPQHDLVIIDPPSLARRRAEQEAALSAYRFLATAGAARTRPGGLVMCCSCSAHVSKDAFAETVMQGARHHDPQIRLIAEASHPADHPHGIAELDYLKMVLLRRSGR